MANAFDCCDRLSKDLTQTQPDPKWQTHIDNQSESIIKKGTWFTDRTMVCLGVEDHSEHLSLSSNHQHIYHIDRENAPDIKPIPQTHKLFQITPERNHASGSKYFITSSLPCSCLPCRKDPTNVESCLCAADRNIEKKLIKQAGENEDDDDITNLLCEDLRDICRLHNLPHAGTKKFLLLRVIPYLQALSDVDVDNNEISD